MQSIILESQKAYSMFESWAGRDNVLPEFPYEGRSHLLKNLEGALLSRVEAWKTN